MYQSIFFEYPNKFWLRDDSKGWFEFEHQATYYKVDPNGTYNTLDGKKVSPTKKYDKEDKFLYEKDVDPKTRVLIEAYRDSDEPASWQNIIYFDIECEIGGALTTEYIRSAPMKITSFALYDNTRKKYFCLILDENNQLKPIKENNKEVLPFKNEADLLKAILDLWEECDPTIITGWNSGFFDIPYLYYRIGNILGFSEASRLSPLRKIKITEWDISQPIELGGINHLDYMLLFKKFVAKQEPSYKLNDIGEKYINLGKIEYEGNLDDLFNEDINKYIDYNLRDVEIILGLENKLKFIELTIAICHLCHVPYEQIYLSTVLNDGAILTYLKRKGIISPNKPTTINPSLKDIKEEYAGGYLKNPIPGLYEWVIDLDYTSLYPSIIRSLNIGIETLIGRIVNNDKYDNNWTLDDLKNMDSDDLIIIERLKEDKTTERKQITVKQIIELIEEQKLLVAASGALFRTDKSSVVCEVLTDWFNKRTEYKNLMKQAYKSGNKELGDFYHQRQHAYKIKLNDVYGCYAINGWRYTDGHKIISKAITLTGQRVTQESIKFVNNLINKKLGTEDKDYVVTSDTDSLFIQLKDLLLFYNIDLNNKQEVINKTLELASEIQKEANKNLDKLVIDLFNIKETPHFFELKQEVVLERGYFAGKRRYAMLIVNKEGVATEEMIMMGLDIMKSNMTPLYKKFGTQLLEDIMHGVSKDKIDQKIFDFKKYIKDRPISEISKPTGVKKIKEYIKSSPKLGEIFSELQLKAPINTKAAIYYNDLLRFKNLDKKYSCFTEGDKIKYIQLKSNPYNIDVIGFNGNNDPDFINELIETYADRDQGFEATLLNKLTGIYEDIGWEFPSLNEKIVKFFKF